MKGHAGLLDHKLVCTTSISTEGLWPNCLTYRTYFLLVLDKGQIMLFVQHARRYHVTIHAFLLLGALLSRF